MQNNAGFFVRLAAYLLDSLIVGAVILFVRIPFWISAIFAPENIVVRDFIFQFSVADILIYILGAAYFVLLTYFGGATIGKKALRLRVESTEGRKLTLVEVIFRETVGRFLSGLVINVGYLMIGIHPEKRSLHDLLADTKVVYDFPEEKKIISMPKQEEVPRQEEAVQREEAAQLVECVEE